MRKVEHEDCIFTHHADDADLKQPVGIFTDIHPDWIGLCDETALITNSGKYPHLWTGSDRMDYL